MKQTAVDWLFQELWDRPKDKMVWFYLLQKAKQMEKKQIIKTYLDSSKETCDSYGDDPPHGDPDYAELYYSQTYED